MPKHIKTIDHLEQEFSNAKTKAIIIDFYATWCGPCKMISPKLEEWEKKYPNIIVLKVDVDEAESIAEKYEISAMPTFLVFKEAKLVETIIGANEEKVENAFKKFNEIEIEKSQEKIVGPEVVGIGECSESVSNSDNGPDSDSDSELDSDSSDLVGDSSDPAGEDLSDTD